ncbi:MAG TPA: efflux RND transporter periplasmic adaptor subunit, partial [Candidatus Obscuribacterales bacterium]
YDAAVTNYETARAVVVARQASLEAARRVLKADEGQLTQAKSTRLNPHMQEQELRGYQKQLLQAEHELKAAERDVASAIAERDEILANIAYLRIESPIDGVVTARSVEPGAVVVPGQTLLSVINLDTVYLRAYVPEEQIGNVRIGQNARVFLDARPKQPLTGRVIQVDPEGSFTPENIYFKQDRVRQVFGIKIAIDKPAGFAKPGMPADAEIIL